MIYAKSLLAGLAALAATAALIVGVAFIAPLLIARSALQGNGGATGFVVVSPWVPLWLILAVPLLVFTAVYFLTFRKLSRSNQQH